MTNLWIVSDLHYDHGGDRLEPPASADIAVIAGDAQDDAWLAHIASQLPTVFVAGNHEFYGWDYQERVAALCGIKGLRFLNDSAVEIDGLRIAGATLWTDYGYSPIAAETARRGMNDHRYIKWSKEPYQRFLPSHATRMHEASVQYLGGVEADVIVTHHAPSERSVHSRFVGSPINRAYYSDMDELVEASGAKVWVHGRVHNNFDYQIGSTRVLCNPKGYPGENASFDPGLVVTV